jgi:hypothetical protein
VRHGFVVKPRSTPDASGRTRILEAIAKPAARARNKATRKKAA